MTNTEPPEPWQERAAAKRASILESIPKRWKLTQADLSRASKQRDLTGSFIQEFLATETIAIISQETEAIIQSLQKQEVSAVQVATAFCQAAAVAHQIVSRS